MKLFYETGHLPPHLLLKDVLNTKSNFDSNPLSFIEINHFRNIKYLEFTPDSKFNFFYGENAQGKTSFLEAIYFLSELKSFRTLHPESLIYHHESEIRLFSKFISSDLNYDVNIKLTANQKEIFLNGKTPRPFRKLRQLLPTILFTPDSVRLFRISPGERRSYFDSLYGILSDVFWEETQQYLKILKQKQKLLEQISLEKISFSLGKSELEIWNEQLTDLGSKIIFNRFCFTQELEQFFISSFEKLSGENWKVKLSYQPYLSLIREDDSISQIKKFLEEEIEKRFSDELERNQVLVGPHRDDWRLTINECNLKEEGSQGQHRIAVAAIKLAEIYLMVKREKTPLALFDDLLSELDSIRSAKVLHLLSDLPCQVFLTSVTPEKILTEGVNGKLIEMKEGRFLEN